MSAWRSHVVSVIGWTPKSVAICSIRQTTETRTSDGTEECWAAQAAESKSMGIEDEVQAAEAVQRARGEELHLTRTAEEARVRRTISSLVPEVVEACRRRAKPFDWSESTPGLPQRRRFGRKSVTTMTITGGWLFEIRDEEGWQAGTVLVLETGEWHYVQVDRSAAGGRITSIQRKPESLSITTDGVTESSIRKSLIEGITRQNCQ